MRVLLVTLAVLTLGAATLNTLNVFFVSENLHADARWFGTIGMGEGVGAVVGALAAGRLCRRFRDVTVFGVGLTLVGVGLVVYARIGTLWAAVLVIALVGVPLGAINSAISPIVLRATPREYIGRAISTFGPVQQLASMVSAIGAGWLVSTVWRDFDHVVAGVTFGRIDTVYLIGGVAIVISGVFATSALRGPGATRLADAAVADETVGAD
ncbi:MFS transporter [Microtetraspora sp. AC03309]|uniref:MFS transporter n=1 Tax=Microtetraspora sp. AC03309 TaxID=2779376 RepID=UPI0027E01874|nr:MFS transporter [Microtetraspora sp. AC03309]